MSYVLVNFSHAIDVFLGLASGLFKHVLQSVAMFATTATRVLLVIANEQTHGRLMAETWLFKTFAALCMPIGAISREPVEF